MPHYGADDAEEIYRGSAHRHWDVGGTHTAPFEAAPQKAAAGRRLFSADALLMNRSECLMGQNIQLRTI